MRIAYQLKVILILFFMMLLLVSCVNVNNEYSIVNEEDLEEFIGENDQNFLEIIEFVPTEKDSSDLIVRYWTSDPLGNTSRIQNYEVALINLKKSYYEKLKYVRYISPVYKAKTLNDFTFISDSALFPYDKPFWYPILEHWKRNNKKEEFEIIQERYIADVSLEEL